MKQAPDTGIARLSPITDDATLLRNLVEKAAVPTFVARAGGDVLYANKAFCDLLGYSREEALKLGISSIVHPDFAEHARDQSRLLESGTTDGYRSERKYIRKDGTAVWVLASAALLREGDDGEASYITVQAIDIDQQKRAEAALASSEGRWNHALEAAGQGVWDADLRADTLFYSRMWRIMRGFGPDEKIEGGLDDWLTRVHPDDRERIRDLVARQDKGEIPRNAFEYREHHRDGHYIWVLSRGAPVEWDEKGVPTRFVGTDTDISALKAVEAALFAEKERLRVTLQSIGDGVISTDAEGRVTFINPVAEQMTGWTSDEALGKSVEDVFVVVDDATGAAVPDPVREALRRQELYYLKEDAVLIGKSGQQCAIHDSAAPVRAADGRILGAVLVFQDITHARAVQKQLAHSALHDGLTGLPNRHAFERALIAATDQARREHREHALCFVDLDRFKVVNDTAGHAAGDVLLREVAVAIQRACRSQDFTARIGGDEFALILADCSMAGAKKAAQQVIDTIASVQFKWNGRRYDIGASVGVAPITMLAPHAIELMRRADRACYVAKEAGRNRVAVYDPMRDADNPLAESA